MDKDYIKNWHYNLPDEWKLFIRENFVDELGDESKLFTAIKSKFWSMDYLALSNYISKTKELFLDEFYLSKKELHIKTLVPLDVFLNLETIHISNLDYLEEIKPLLKNRNLKTVFISGCDQIKDWSYLNGLINMERLSIHSKSFTQLEFIIQLTKLKEITLHNLKIGNDLFYKVFSTLVNLEKIEIHSCIFEGDEKEFNETFSYHSNLKQLILPNSNIFDFQFLKFLPNLEVLSLPNTSINNIDDIIKMVNLKYLNVENCNIAPNDISKLLSKFKNTEIKY